MFSTSNNMMNMSWLGFSLAIDIWKTCHLCSAITYATDCPALIQFSMHYFILVDKRAPSACQNPPKELPWQTLQASLTIKKLLQQLAHCYRHRPIFASKLHQLFSFTQSMTTLFAFSSPSSFWLGCSRDEGFVSPSARAERFYEALALSPKRISMIMSVSGRALL